MAKLLELVADINNVIFETVRGVPLAALIVCTGIFMSLRINFLQFRKFAYVMKNTLGKIFDAKPAKKGSLTPFQAVTTALAGTIGTGNIAGVTGAIALGGPGAVFWMWISAFFGMATKYSEIVLAVRYRERNKKGEWVGGPMYYIKNGLGENYTWLAYIFSFFGALAALGSGNIVQANTISGSVAMTIAAFSGAAASQKLMINILTGIAIALITASVLLGGVKRIGQVTEKVIPFMSLLYIVAALTVIVTNLENAASVIGMIFRGAFNPAAAVGGFFGFTLTDTIKRGVGRGVFSNEAGLGSAPIAHASADTNDPAAQGMFGIFEVFVDTILICTLTALAVLMSGVPIPWGSEAGADLTITAFAAAFGGKAAGMIISGCIALFAVSSILSWALYGSRCVEFLLGGGGVKKYQILFILTSIAGAAMDLGLAWDIAETLNGLMAITNLIAVLALSGATVGLTRRHPGFRQPV